MLRSMARSARKIKASRDLNVEGVENLVKQIVDAHQACLHGMEVAI